MTLAVVVGLLTAIFKAVPKLKEWFDQLLVMYTESQIDSMRRENYEALRKAIRAKDQRDLEKAIGHPEPGRPSNDAGTIIQPGPPPNVVRETGSDRR